MSGTQAKPQPIPAVDRLPSGTLVEVLCGQPEQKYGIRFSVILGLERAFSLALIQSTRALTFSRVRGCRSRRSTNDGVVIDGSRRAIEEKLVSASKYSGSPPTSLSGSEASNDGNLRKTTVG